MMKKYSLNLKFLYLILSILLVITISGCSKKLDYVKEDFLPDESEKTLFPEEGITLKEIEESISDVIVITTNSEYYQKENISFKRFVFKDLYVLQLLNGITKSIEDNLSLIQEVFQDPEDIAHIYMNEELGSIVMLPKGDVALTNKNTVFIEFSIGTDLLMELGSTLYSIDFRDIIVSQLNIDYSESSLITLRSYFSALTMYGKEESRIFYIDMFIGEESVSRKSSDNSVISINYIEINKGSFNVDESNILQFINTNTHDEYMWISDHELIIQYFI